MASASNTTQVETEFPSANTEFVITMLHKDMLYHFYKISRDKHDTKMMETIEAAWEKRFGTPFNPQGVGEFIPTFLHGEPGHGKTTSFKIAGKQVAQDLGLNFVLNPGEDYTPEKNDLLFISLELSGEVSPMSIGGMPAKKETEGTEYMTKIPYHRLAMGHKAGFGLLLFDDVGNASKSIQNMVLSIAEELRYQGVDFSNFFVGLTANLGALDHSYANKASAPLLTRCKNIHVFDTLQNFSERTNKKYKDALGDAHVLGFLNKHPEFFSEMPTKDGPFPCPRTWSKGIDAIRRFVIDKKTTYAQGSDTDISFASHELNIIAASLVGLKTAKQLSSYYHNLFTGALPVAEEFIAKGELTPEKKALYDKNMKSGHSADSHDFSYQLALSLANEAVSQLKFHSQTSDEKSGVIANYAKGLMALDLGMTSLSVNQFYRKIDPNSKMTLDQKKVIAEVMQKHTDNSHYAVFVDIISNSAGFQENIANLDDNNTLKI